MTAFVVKHLEIDGSTIDQDHGWLDVHLELHPLGTLLPKDQQGEELHITVGKTKTVIDIQAIAQLKKWLIEESVA